MTPKILESEIIYATVYSDRAQITRRAELSSQIGEQTVSFENITQFADSRSFQIKGKGNFILKDIRFREVLLMEFNNEEKNKLTAEIEVLQDEMNGLRDELNVLITEKKQISGVVDKLIAENTSFKTLPEPEFWLKMVNLSGEKIGQADKACREIEKKIKNVQKNIDALQFRLNQTGGQNGKKKFAVDCTILTEKEENLIIYLQYMSFNANWKPVYNFRVHSDEKKLQVEYAGEISQNTDENWKNIGITLSTAQVQVSGNIPELKPLYLNKMRFDDFEADELNDKMKYKKSMPVMAKSVMREEKEKTEFLAEANIPVSTKTTVSEKTTSSVFETEGVWAIESNNKPHRVNISVFDLESTFEYACVPLLSPYSFLTAKTKNNSAYPLLPGRANVFFDGNFVAETRCTLILPEQEFDTSLGVDEGIKIERKTLPESNKNEGIFTKKNKRVLSFETTITNHKKHEIKILITERIPMSQSDDIVVETLEPKLKENDEALKLGKDGILKKTFTIKPSEKAIFPLKYSVEYPQDIAVDGL